MITLSAAIMAHPARKDFIAELVSKLDRPAAVVWDRGNNNRWDTGSRALLSYESNATHHLVVQDDAVVCRDLCAGVEKALDYLSTATTDPTPLGLYMGRRFRRRCRLFNPSTTSWFVMPLYWGVAVVLPVDLIDDIVRWGDRHPHIDNYDLRISERLKSRQIPVWHPWPSMVDHRIGPSLVPGRGSSGRYALRFLGTNESALDHDWSGQVIHRIDTARSRRRQPA